MVAGEQTTAADAIFASPYSQTDLTECLTWVTLTCGDCVHLMHTEPTLSFRVLQVLAEESRFVREALAQL